MYKWHDVIDTPLWDCDNEYRMKPRTITINGKEYNAPMNTAPAMGTKYHILNLFGKNWIDSWTGSKQDINRLNSCRAFETAADCQAVADAFETILRGAE
jgi:hypothetical protein